MSDTHPAVQVTPTAAIAITIINPNPNAAIVVAPIALTIVQPAAPALSVTPDPIVEELRADTAQMQPIAAAPIVLVLGGSSGPPLVYSIQPQLVPSLPLSTVPRQRREPIPVIEVGQTFFMLAAEAIQPQLSELYVNGIKQTFGEDYAINGSILTWLSSLILEPSDDMEILYLS